MKDIIKLIYKIDNMRILHVAISLLVLVSPQFAKPQDSKGFPAIGESVPEFKFEKFEGPYTGELTRNGIKGRYVILDFWGTGCMACIASMPKMNSLNERFKDKLDIIFVGKEEKKRSISGLYKVLKQKYNLNLISAYDSLYFHKFVHLTVPYLLWINPGGIIKAITTSTEATEENIIKFLSDIPFKFNDASFAASKNPTLKVDNSSPLLIDGNGGPNKPEYLFRSVLYRWKLGYGNGSYQDVETYLSAYSRDLFQTTRANLFMLYRLAYFGTSTNIAEKSINPKTVLNCADTSMFRFSYVGDGTGLYNYSVQIPKELATKERVMKTMQEDLHKYFGFRVKIVDMEVPYLALIVSDLEKASKIVVKSSNLVVNWGPEQKNAQLLNIPADQLKVYVPKYLPGRNIVLDETNLKGNVNLSISGKELSNLENLRKGLQKYGLDLKPSAKMMKTLVISDPELEKVGVNN